MAEVTGSSKTVPYPFQFDSGKPITGTSNGVNKNLTISVPNCRGHIPSVQASRLRSMIIEASQSTVKILAVVTSDDPLSSQLCERAGFPAIFLAGFAMSASLGLPDTGYIAFHEVVQKIQDTARVTSVPIIVDADTGYGAPTNVRRTVEGFAHAGAAGVMVEDQTWPKRCGHTRGKSVVSRAEAYARWQAAVDARNEGLDIWIMARTDSFILGYDEMIARSRKAIELGVDCLFLEALPDRATMARAIKELMFPCFANIIEGGKTENLSALELAGIGYSAVAYPWTLVAAKLKYISETLENVKKSLTTGAPPEILSYDGVINGVGFDRYFELEDRYQYEGQPTGMNGYKFEQ